jgi:hypothetical protein
VVATLNPLIADASGNASATTMVSLSLATIQSASHIVAVHVGATLETPEAACTQIPVVSGVSVAAPATVAATAGGISGADIAAVGGGLGVLKTGAGIWQRPRSPK